MSIFFVVLLLVVEIVFAILGGFAIFKVNLLPKHSSLSPVIGLVQLAVSAFFIVVLVAALPFMLPSIKKR